MKITMMLVCFTTSRREIKVFLHVFSAYLRDNEGKREHARKSLLILDNRRLSATNSEIIFCIRLASCYLSFIPSHRAISGALYCTIIIIILLYIYIYIYIIVVVVTDCCIVVIIIMPQRTNGGV